MSLMSWLFSSKKSAKSAPQTGPNSGSQRRSPRQGAASGGGSAKRKSERATRRELLYAVVREAMVRAGVPSSRRAASSADISNTPWQHCEQPARQAR